MLMILIRASWPAILSSTSRELSVDASLMKISSYLSVTLVQALLSRWRSSSNTSSSLRNERMTEIKASFIITGAGMLTLLRRFCRMGYFAVPVENVFGMLIVVVGCEK